MEFDYLVVGAGIAGASVAYQLSPLGQVALLERESQPGYHSTGRSAALFMETYGTPTIRALTCASRAFYESPPTGFADHPILSARGAMHVAGIGQEQELTAAFARARTASSRVVLMSADEVLARCPVLREDLICGALYESDAMDMDVHALHQGYLRGFRARGGQSFYDAELAEACFDSEVGGGSAFGGSGGKWSVRLADNRTLTVTKIVNAAGAWADAVAQRCGVAPIGLQPKRRTAFTFAPPADVGVADWPMVIGIDETYYFKPDAGQLLGSPANADPVEPHDVLPEELDVATGIHFVEAMTMMRIRRPKHVWAGLRSFVPDGDLVVGADDDVTGFYWVAAQGGYGIQTAAAVSQLAAAQLGGQPTPEHIAGFGVRPDQLSPRRLRSAAIQL